MDIQKFRVSKFGYMWFISFSVHRMKRSVQ
jgi:hypothetical protein